MKDLHLQYQIFQLYGNGVPIREFKFRGLQPQINCSGCETFTAGVLDLGQRQLVFLPWTTAEDPGKPRSAINNLIFLWNEAFLKLKFS